MEYTTLNGLTLLDDPDSKKYDLKVGPNDIQIIILEAGFEGFGTAGRGGT
jgi:hypothetical protein